MRIGFFISLVLWALLAMCIVGHTDMIGGVIVDNETMQAKEGVTVEIRQCHCGKPFRLPPIKTVVTNRFGTYEACVPAGSIYKITPIPKDGGKVIPEHGFIDVMEPCK